MATLRTPHANLPHPPHGNSTPHGNPSLMATLRTPYVNLPHPPTATPHHMATHPSWQPSAPLMSTSRTPPPPRQLHTPWQPIPNGNPPHPLCQPPAPHHGNSTPLATHPPWQPHPHPLKRRASPAASHS
ncbi:extensin-like [Penaeus chinensis]|uniref:extensin-like n=1 Tax=Penaeus chinensis TaxID=139456 RepID=UPI001FB5F6B3|nr:extensin-like [Penaeus chinensis]